MGRDACAAVVRFLVQHTRCRTVVDPFCGMGTALAVANEFGLNAVGVERSAKRARKARELAFPARFLGSGGKRPSGRD
jgi:tRNA/tmRNA/rRNA uracil-C5-methylase (TrmA/RlmC/RlmD family)